MATLYPHLAANNISLLLIWILASSTLTFTLTALIALVPLAGLHLYITVEVALTISLAVKCFIGHV